MHRQKAELPENKEKANHRVLRRFTKFICKLVIIVVAVILLLQFVGEIHVLHSNDMFPALRDGDLCITYKLQKPISEEIIAFEADGKVRFGRVVGVEGDVIDISEEGQYTINGNIPYETVFYDTKRVENSTIQYPYTVEAGSYFVLCDQRETGHDSRAYGAIPATDVKGTVVLMLRHRGW